MRAPHGGGFGISYIHTATAREAVNLVATIRERTGHGCVTATVHRGVATYWKAGVTAGWKLMRPVVRLRGCRDWRAHVLRDLDNIGMLPTK